MTQSLTLYNMDVLASLAKISDESVDCIVTSPPYWGLRDYGVEGQIGLEVDYRSYLDRMLVITEELMRVLKPSGTMWWNVGDTYNGNKSGNTNYKLSQTLKDNQKGMVKTAQSGLQEKSRMLLPERFAIRMVDEQGWTCRNDIVWHKPNHMPSSVRDRLGNAWEHVYLFTKQRRYYFNLDAIREAHKYPNSLIARKIALDKTKSVKRFDAQSNKTKQDSHPNRQIAGFNHRYKNPGDVWDISPQQRNWSNKNHDRGHAKKWDYNGDDFWRITTKPYKQAHFATFPPELPERCIKAGCPADGTVLDPFAGSGTTLQVALGLGRNAIGIEINPKYISLIEARTGALQRQKMGLEYLKVEK